MLVCRTYRRPERGSQQRAIESRLPQLGIRTARDYFHIICLLRSRRFARDIIPMGRRDAGPKLSGGSDFDENQLLKVVEVCLCNYLGSLKEDPFELCNE